MTQTSINYARVLYGLSVSPESIKEAKEIFEKTPQLFPVLERDVYKRQVTLQCLNLWNDIFP